MSEQSSWLITRFVIPFFAALCMVLFRWGKENISYILTVPVFLLLLRIYVGYLEKPSCPELESYRPYRLAIRKWHNTEVISLLFLMFFEAFNAGLAGNRDGLSLLKNAVICFVHYTLLTFRARTWLRRAQEMANFSRKYLGEREPAL